MNQVRIRPIEASDAASLFEAATESIAEVHPWLPWCRPGYQQSEAAGWVALQLGHWLTRTEFQFAIVAADGRFLGGCGINAINSEHRCANLGYWVRTSALGLGAATRATRLARDWAMKNTGLERLEIIAAVDNLPSLRVAEKAGATHEGTLRARLCIHGQSHDAQVYSFTR
ncbi:MAG: ribosomal-protein-serine acetyltransferase [Planctomycetota bacterium]|jgi:ribosomal-protein-serine acetyltransferase